jgi:hypothetical protein
VGKKDWKINENIPQSDIVFELCKALDERPNLKIIEVKEGVAEYQEKGETISKELLAIIGRIDFEQDGQGESLEFQFSHHLENGIWSYRIVSLDGDEIAKKEISQNTLLRLHDSLFTLYHESAPSLQENQNDNQSH